MSHADIFPAEVSSADVLETLQGGAAGSAEKIASKIKKNGFLISALSIVHSELHT
jgi:hypothetical protein